MNQDNIGYKIIGLIESGNPHTVVMRFREDPLKFFMRKDEFGAFLKDQKDECRVYCRTNPQISLWGEQADPVVIGVAKITGSKKGIRYVLKDGRVLYSPRGKVFEMMCRRLESCPVSERIVYS